jgi:hypothetical protein
MASFIPAIIGGLAGLFGGNSTKQTQTNQTTNQSANQNYNNTNSTTPNLNPFQQQLAQLFTSGAVNQYNQGTNLAPYTSQGLQQIQGQNAQNSKTISNNLAARGLSYSPVAGNAQTLNTINSGNQMQQFLQGVPLLQHQLQQGNLQQLMQAFSTQPTGVTQTGSGSGTSTGTSTMNGTQTQSTPGGGLAGLLSGFGAGFLGGGGLSGLGFNGATGGGVPAAYGSVPAANTTGWTFGGQPAYNYGTQK